MDAVTGSWSGVDMCVYQCHIRASAGRDGGKECLFGYNDQSWSLFALPPVTHSYTIIERLISL